MQGIPLEGHVYRELRGRYDRACDRLGSASVGIPTPQVVRYLANTTRPVAQTCGAKAVITCIAKIGDAYEAAPPASNGNGWSQVFQTAIDAAAEAMQQRSAQPVHRRTSSRRQLMVGFSVEQTLAMTGDSIE